MGRRKLDKDEKANRPLSSSEWRVLHCVYTMTEDEEERVTAVRVRERLASPPYNRDIELNFVKVLLIRIEAGGYLTATPIPREAGQPGRMEYSYRPTREFERVVDQLARRLLEDLLIGDDFRAVAVLRRILKEKAAKAGPACEDGAKDKSRGRP